MCKQTTRSNFTPFENYTICITEVKLLVTMNENATFMRKEYSYGILFVFAICVSMASQKGVEIITMDGFASIFRFILYIIVIHIVELFSNILYSAFTNGTIDFGIIMSDKEKHIAYGVLMGISLYIGNGKLFDEMFLYLTIAYSICGYLERDPGDSKRKTFISYGVGMACSFYEGYLVHILPNDGTQFDGFEKNIERYEAVHKVSFPVKKLFLIITKKLYCPPDLADFNKDDKNLSYLEACLSLQDVKKDVAGVKNRKYRNSIYKIYRSGADPVYLSAECATPLHTLQKVKERRAEYEELANADFEEIVSDFCRMLQSIIDNSRNCYKKIELIYYDDTNPNLNLADILLERIKQSVPGFK